MAMKFKFLWIVILNLMISQGFAQSLLEKGSVFIGGDVGLSFYNKELAYYSDQIPQGYSMDDALRASLTPKIHYSIFDDIFIIGQLGFDYSNYKRQSDSRRYTFTNYRIGVGVKYYFLEIAKPVFLSAEAGVNYNYLQMNQRFVPLDEKNNTLTSAYLDIGIDLDLGEGWIFTIVLKDLIEYQSDTPNFKHREGWKVNNVFKHLIRYPHFSFLYKIK